MTLPFGFYLRYYFQNRLKQIIVKTFLLSLFFELTQLSGLYFIYSGNYRLFDVDDLITNTLGGVFGFLLANLLANFLPTRAEIDQKSFDRSKKISLLRRLIALTFDSIASILFIAIVSIRINAYGTEILIELQNGESWGSNKNIKAKVLKIEKNIGNMAIPPGKAVISAHGTAEAKLEC